MALCFIYTNIYIYILGDERDTPGRFGVWRIDFVPMGKIAWLSAYGMIWYIYIYSSIFLYADRAASAM